MIVLCTHVNPDGDGLGSMLALARAGRSAGKTVTPTVLGTVPRKYAFLFPDEDPADEHRFAQLATEADLVVVLDTSAPEQLAPVLDTLRNSREKVVVVDHHAAGGDIGQAQWVDPTAAAAGLMVGELIQRLGWDIDARTATHLSTAVLTDTGWLRFSNTDGRTLRAVADWFDRGVSPDELYDRLFQRDRVERLRLMALAIDSLELFCRSRLAVMMLRAGDFAHAGASRDETENIINEALRIETVEVAVMLVETPERIRVSLRSRGEVDVSTIAASMGGGGHARAAGLKADGPIALVRDQLVRTCRKALGCPKQ